MKATKIKLINWHNFSNHTFNIKGNFLLTGGNGSGKSTIIDAIFYLLSGGEYKFFNNAANNEARRTLESYMRCKVGKEGKEYLRPNSDVISHIAIEFSDDKDKKMVVGCLLELQNGNSKPRTYFYYLNNHQLEDIDYIDENKKIRSKKNFDSYCKDNNIEKENINDNKRKTRRDLGRIFGIKDYEKYYSLLQKSISFKPISEVNTFVNDFLLPEENIEIDSLKEDFRNFRQIQDLVIKENKKIEFLDSFIEKAEKIVAYKRENKYFEVIKKELDITENENIILDDNNKIDKLNNDLKQKDYEKEEINKKRNSANTNLMHLENNEIYKAIKEKEDEIKNNQNIIDESNKKLEIFDNDLSQEIKIMKSIGKDYSFYKDIRNENYDLLKKHLEDYKNDIEIYEKDNFLKESELLIHIENLTKEYKNLESEYKELKKGRNKYNDKVESLLAILKENLPSKVAIKPLCEYLEVTDKQWQNALEGYLNNHRFDIVVEPKYFLEACKYYEAYKKERNIYGVGIINTEKEDIKVLENSLFSKIECKDENALVAAKRLLGNVICVEKIDDLSNYNKAITKSVMVYSNKIARNINPKTYEKPYIGVDSINQRINLLEKEINDKNIEITDLKNKLKGIEEILSQIRKSKIKNLITIDNYWKKIKDLSQRNNYLKEQIKIEENNPDLLTISEQIDNYKKELKSLDREYNSIEKEAKEINFNIGSISSDINKCEEKLKSLNDEHRHLLNMISNRTDYEVFSNNLKTADHYNKAYVDEKSHTNGSFISNVKNNVEKLMREYSDLYCIRLNPSIEEAQSYVDEYYEVKNRNLARFIDEADQARRNSEKDFKESFINELADKITTAKETLRKLNKQLKNYPFGNDEEVYEFTFSAAKDNDLNQYYKIITSGKLMESDNLFSEVLNERENEAMQELFDKILSDDATNLEKDISKYLDYRQYMNYDIKTSNKRSEESYYSKTSREKSGGETQTPFYIIIASCFEGHLNNSKDSTCLVLLDEAFNNMDSERIGSIMKFYNDLNIQLSIAIPDNRIQEILPVVDTSFLLIKDNNYVAVRDLNNA